MKCEEVLELLEGYVDDSLESLELEHVDTHLGTCSDCLAELAAMRQENAFYAGFASRLDAEAPEWRDVRAAIGPSEDSSAPWYTRLFSGFLMPAPMLAAATAVLVITAAIGILVLREQPGSESAQKNKENEIVASVPSGSGNAGPRDLADPADVSPVPSSERKVTPNKRRVRKPKRRVQKPEEPRTPFTLEMIGSTDGDPNQIPALVAVNQASSVYEAAIQQLRPEYESRKTSLGSEASRRLDATIKELDLAIAGTKTAVASNPNDPEAMQSLLAVYSQKVELLQNIASR